MAAIEAARTAINAAETAEAAQMAKDAVNDIATATEAAGLQAAVDARIMALNMMAREAAQKMALIGRCRHDRHVRPVDPGGG